MRSFDASKVFILGGGGYSTNGHFGWSTNPQSTAMGRSAVRSLPRLPTPQNLTNVIAHEERKTSSQKMTLLTPINHPFLIKKMSTLPETHIAAARKPSQKEMNHLPTIHFQVRTVSFREGNIGEREPKHDDLQKESPIPRCKISGSMINFRGFFFPPPRPENVKPIGNSPSKKIKRIILANALKSNFQQ